MLCLKCLLHLAQRISGSGRGLCGVSPEAQICPAEKRHVPFGRRFGAGGADQPGARQRRHDRRRSTERRRNAAGTGDVSGTGACGSQGRFAGYAQSAGNVDGASQRGAEDAGRAAQGASCGTAALSEDGAVVAERAQRRGLWRHSGGRHGPWQDGADVGAVAARNGAGTGGLRAGGLSGFAPAELARRGGEIRARPALQSADGDGGSAAKAD